MFSLLLKSSNRGARFLDNADAFVPEYCARGAGCNIATTDVKICSADGRFGEFDDYVGGFGYGWFRAVFELHFAGRCVDECFHSGMGGLLVYSWSEYSK
jgi:hypothetical protein